MQKSIIGRMSEIINIGDTILKNFISYDKKALSQKILNFTDSMYELIKDLESYVSSDILVEDDLLIDRYVKNLEYVVKNIEEIFHYYTGITELSNSIVTYIYILTKKDTEPCELDTFGLKMLEEDLVDFEKVRVNLEKLICRPKIKEIYSEIVTVASLSQAILQDDGLGNGEMILPEDITINEEGFKKLKDSSYEAYKRILEFSIIDRDYLIKEEYSKEIDTIYEWLSTFVVYLVGNKLAVGLIGTLTAFDAVYQEFFDC